MMLKKQRHDKLICNVSNEDTAKDENNLTIFHVQ